jgi:hypothetical protein
MKRVSIFALILLLAATFAYGSGVIIKRRIAGGGTPADNTFTVAVADNTDDGTFQYGAVWVYSSLGQDNEAIGWAGGANSNYSWAFVRFTVPTAILSTATVSSATLRLYGYGNWLWTQGTDDLFISATDANNPAAPTTAGERPSTDGGSTTLTTENVAWSDVSWVNNWNASVDISTILQELVTSDYLSTAGDNVIIWVRGTTTTNHAVGFYLKEHAIAHPAELSITW